MITLLRRDHILSITFERVLKLKEFSCTDVPLNIFVSFPSSLISSLNCPRNLASNPIKCPSKLSDDDDDDDDEAVFLRSE